jgi:hypothetical protein
MKNTTIGIIVGVAIIILGLGIYFWTRDTVETVPPVATSTVTTTTTTTTTVTDKTKTVLGTSVQNRPITAYHYGTGETEILFVGGIHGGYEWNTSLVAYQLMDYLSANPSVIPQNVTVSVIPVVNPDGLAKVVGTDGPFTAAQVSKSADTQVAGRFNANTVDLNRNFDCDWQSQGKWQSKTVSGGTAAFSEPESLAIKNYVDSRTPAAVVVWYSAAGGVFASNCHTGVSAQTAELTKEYAKASGYKAYDSFDFYETTGDMVNWLAKEGVPAISVLLTNHQDTEWTKNKAGIEAILKHYAIK